jgi:putative restriction endonuclease
VTAPAPLDEMAVRLAAIDFVNTKAASGTGVVTRAELESFTYAGQPLKLIDQSRGIRNPRQLAATLSILSQPDGPYDDVRTADGLMRYAYRDGPTDNGDNRKLRRAAELGLPLVLLEGIASGVFVPVAPVYLVRDLPDERCVEVAVDEGLRYLPGTPSDEQRSYVERLTKMRLHQPIFRARVIRAYGAQCAMCQLRHAELLDAAHIIPDTQERGQPVVPNGLSLCKIHHAAYDRNILGVRPDLVIDVKQRILDEVDGPMLLHGIQEMAGQRIVVPTSASERPDPDRLEERYEEFTLAS